MRYEERKAQQSNMEYKYGLFDCCHNPSRCCYIWCCMTCAIADLSLVINPCCIESKQLRWWLIVLANLIFAIICGSIFSKDRSGGAAGILSPMFVIAFYVVYTASMHIARKIGYQMEEFGCSCCCSYFCCSTCKACQIANQLDVDHLGTQSPETVELITEINQDTLFKNCLCQVTNPAAPANRFVEIRNTQSMNVAQEIEQSDKNTYNVFGINPNAYPQQHPVQVISQEPNHGVMV